MYPKLHRPLCVLGYSYQLIPLSRAPCPHETCDNLVYVLYSHPIEALVTYSPQEGPELGKVVSLTRKTRPQLTMSC